MLCCLTASGDVATSAAYRPYEISHHIRLLSQLPGRWCHSRQACPLETLLSLCQPCLDCITNTSTQLSSACRQVFIRTVATHCMHWVLSWIAYHQLYAYCKSACSFVLGDIVSDVQARRQLLHKYATDKTSSSCMPLHGMYVVLMSRCHQVSQCTCRKVLKQQHTNMHWNAHMLGCGE